jgi:uncharacterized membrane protein HdeD (DUF308 family)
MAGALASILAVRRVADIDPPMTTFVRSGLLSALAYIAAAAWPADGLLILAKLPAIALLICAGYLALGEFSAAEINLVRSIGDWRGSSRDAPLEAE